MSGPSRPALQQLRTCSGIAESVILSTCNRVEVAVTALKRRDPQAEVDRFPERIEEPGSGWVTLRPISTATMAAAIHHLFRVASSLDSMVVGEPQILGQFKAAYAVAKARARSAAAGRC